jgi:hypothetical protein
MLPIVPAGRWPSRLRQGQRSAPARRSVASLTSDSADDYTTHALMSTSARVSGTSSSGSRGALPGSYRSGQTGLTVNQLAYAFGGSNPPLPTAGGLHPAGNTECPSSSGVEHNLGKVGVTGSIPVSGSGSPFAIRRRAGNDAAGCAVGRFLCLGRGTSSTRSFGAPRRRSKDSMQSAPATVPDRRRVFREELRRAWRSRSLCGRSRT